MFAQSGQELHQTHAVIVEMILHALITARIDYCNSLYYGVNECVLEKLQIVQNACARLLSNVSRFNHITPVLIELHWLPVKGGHHHPKIGKM